MSDNCPYLNNPETFKINRMDARSIFRLSQTNGSVEDLSGTWKFEYYRHTSEAPDNFTASDYDITGLEDIKVPGMIELQGHSCPQYINVQYPWDAFEKLQAPEIPEEYNPVGIYYRDVDLDLEKNDEVILSFYGVQTAFDLWVNGKEAGYAEDSFTLSEFNITDLVKQGRNRIAVRVFKYSTASWLEDQDYWRMTGIFRPVTISVKKHGWIREIKVETNLYDDYTDGELCVTVRTDAEKVALRTEEKEIYAFTDGPETELVLHFSDPDLWSAEHPNLIDFSVETMTADETVLERAELSAGFREIRIEDGIFYINNRRIVFNGVNRHEWSPVTGRSISLEEMEKDVMIMKRNNINAVRTSHYPNHPYFYHLCDKYGLYVIAEANLETHGTWGNWGEKENILPGDKEQWLAAVIDRQRNNYESFKNHTSVIMWSLGNESHGGEVLKLAADYLHSVDRSRPVQYEGVFQDRTWADETSDIESQMYVPAEEVEIFLRRNTDKPFILQEYSHAMGNSCGDIMDYIRLTRTEEHFQGGFIWDFIDQTFLDDTNGISYGGDLGDRPSDFSFCADGLIFSDRTESPKMQEIKYAYQPFEIDVGEDEITITNRTQFTNLHDYRIVVTQEKDGVPEDSREYTFNLIPGYSKSFPNPFIIEDEEREHSWCIRVSVINDRETPWSPAGFEVAHDEMVEIAHTEYREHENPITYVNGDFNFGFRTKTLKAIVERGKGKLISLRKNGEEIFRRSPYLSFWRAPVDNDRGSDLTSKMARWSAEGLWAKSQGSVLDEENDEKVVKTLYTLPVSGDDIVVEQGYSGDGRIRITLSYRGREALVPEFGVAFTLFEKFDDVTYLGLGPEENMPDRQEGAKFGIWKFNAKDNLTKYAVPQEAGTRCGVKWAKVGPLTFEAEDDMIISISPYTAEEVEEADHHGELPEPRKTVVRILKGMMGVGGDNSWGALPHQDALFRICYGDTFTFYIS